MRTVLVAISGCALLSLPAIGQFVPQQTLLHTNVERIWPTFSDYNGDGTDDFIGYSVSNNSVDLVSGTNSSLLRRYTGINFMLGAQFASIPDADGDGRREFLVGTESDVWALRSNGAGGPISTAPRLYALQGLPFAPVLANSGATTMIAFGDQSRAMLIDSATGNVRARIENPGAGNLGQSAVALGDVNGDGIGDFASSGGNINHFPDPRGTVFVLGGQTQTVGSSFTPISSLTNAEKLAELTGVEFMGHGQSLGVANTSVNVGDPTPNNGIAESLIVTGSPIANFGAGGLAAHVLTQAGGGTVTTTRVAAFTNSQNTYFGTAVSDVGDVNGDGVRDVAVLNKEYQLASQRVGQILIVSGAGLLDGFQPGTDVVQTLTGSPTAFFESSMFSMGDYNHDGRPDLGVSVLYNGLNGQFGPALQIYSVPAPSALAAAVGAGLFVLRRRRS